VNQWFKLSFSKYNTIDRMLHLAQRQPMLLQRAA
jgi:hypothetical protein